MIDDSATAEVVRDLTLTSAGPRTLDTGKYHAWLSPGGQLHQVDLTGDRWLDWPRRKAGTFTVQNVASFKQYWDKHHDDASEVFADLDKGTVTAVLDAHGSYETGHGGEDGARWQQHRLILALQLTRPWQDWTARDRQWMGQQEFAEFLEEHARDIDPGGTINAADLLECAQHFKATVKTAITSSKRLRDGQTQFEYMEEIESAGRSASRGTIDMPGEFDLAIRPYDDCPVRPVAVRLRYRLRDDKKLVLGYFMNDPARVAREAVAEVVAKLEAECGVQVMHGQPA